MFSNNFNLVSITGSSNFKLCTGEGNPKIPFFLIEFPKILFSLVFSWWNWLGEFLIQISSETIHFVIIFNDWSPWFKWVSHHFNFTHLHESIIQKIMNEWLEFKTTICCVLSQNFVCFRVSIWNDAYCSIFILSSFAWIWLEYSSGDFQIEDFQLNTKQSFQMSRNVLISYSIHVLLKKKHFT